MGIFLFALVRTILEIQVELFYLILSTNSLESHFEFTFLDLGMPSKKKNCSEGDIGPFSFYPLPP